MKKYPLFQQAYMVNDIQEAASRWRDLFGAGPFVVTWHHRVERFDYKGCTTQPDVSYAFGYLGDQMIQLVEQHDDTPSIYRDMYPPGQEGLHHIAYLKHDVVAEIERLGNLGFPPVCELSVTGVHAAYFDTRPVIGAFTEVHNTPPRIVSAFALWKHAHEMASSDTPVIIPRPDAAEATAPPISGSTQDPSTSN